MNHLSMPIAERIVAASQASDAALDAGAFVALLTPDVTFRLGSAEPIHGRDAVRAAVTQLFDAMLHIQHTTRTLLLDGDRIFLEAEVRFEPKGGHPLTLPYVNVLTVAASELVSEYRIHIDLAPLFAGAGR